MRSRGLAVLFFVAAGLFGRAPHGFAYAEKTIAAQVAQSDRALEAAVQELPAISAAGKQALLACIDHHLTCNRRDLADAIERDGSAGDEVAEYRATELKLRELRQLVERAC